MALTALDIHRIIEQKVQTMSFFAYKDIESEEVDIIVNEQIDLLINGILDKHFGRDLKINEEQGFQKNQVSLDNLRTLHHITTIHDTTFFKSEDLISVGLPATYYHHIKSVATITYKCYDEASNKEVDKVENDVEIRVSLSQYNLKSNPFYKTGRDSILAELAGSSLIMYVSDFDISKIVMSYIRKPAVFKYAKDINGNYDPINSVQTDIDGSLHYMLANMASIEIMKILQQNPQKIVNLKQTTV